MKPLVPRWVTLIAAMACVLALPAAASGHSRLVGSVPASGATVDVASEIVLRFSEPVSVPPADAVRVQDVHGNELDVGVPAVDGSTLRVPLAEPPQGTLLVEWQAVNDHGSAVSGSFVFHVGAPSSELAASSERADRVAAAAELSKLSRALAGSGLLLAMAAGIGWLAVRRRPQPLRAAAASFGAGAGAIAVLALCAVPLTSGAGDDAGTTPAAAGVRQQVSIGDGLNASVTLTPAAAGLNFIAVDITGEGGALDDSVEGAYVRYMPLMDDASPYRYELTGEGTGRFVGDELVIPGDGLWRVRVHLSTSAFSERLVSFDAMVAPNPALRWEVRR